MNGAHSNVASRLAAFAAEAPERPAVFMPQGRDRNGKRQYASLTFRELDQDSDRLARGLRELGVRPGTRLALLVKPSIDFISLVFALFKAGAVTILIDPGMGRKNLLACLEAAEPEGFVAIPAVQAVRTILRRRFPQARHNVTVGRRWFWGGVTIDQLRGGPWTGAELAPTAADDPAAIIFTTGSTGPPKGVLYRHGNFDRQVTEIRDFYGIRPGEVDLAGFPLFGLFNAAMGVTTVIPDMDASRPASVDPANIVEAVVDCQATQAFASPAVWNRVGPYCVERGIRLPSLRRVLSAGAPVPPHVLESMMSVIGAGGEMHTPYGATESLPVASIAASEVLAETAELARQGAGTCVGRKFPGIEWKVIRAVEGPLATLADAEELPQGEIGELIVRGPAVTREYATRTEWNALSKIADGSDVWHRIGDVGYFDDRGRFWYCGRAAHRVRTPVGPMYTECCEAIFNNHPAVFRSALVGIGQAGLQRPVIVVEPRPGKMPQDEGSKQAFLEELRTLAASSPLTSAIADFRFHPSFPVDIRHNAKIFREKLAAWAAAARN
ncbi:MAG TPA: fatty acid CoA ligase family protein [Pirellulales bacterium]|nr:fatty acid CoA ligase family protein [Pirellulales bacterium]